MNPNLLQQLGLFISPTPSLRSLAKFEPAKNPERSELKTLKAREKRQRKNANRRRNCGNQHCGGNFKKGRG